MIRLEDYDYALPPELVAMTPAEPREHARLFVYDTSRDVITFDTFKNIGRHLPHPALLVMNNTKVVPARLWLKKISGGKIQVLLLMNEYRQGDTLIKGLADRNVPVGTKLFFRNGDTLNVVGKDQQFFLFRPSVPIEQLVALLEKEGVTPIPPYIKHTPLSETFLRERYQSILAKYPASVAAPTASLHFTKELLTTLATTGITYAEITLHVGAGTFAPISETQLKSKKLFAEYYEISPETAERIMEAKRANVPVVTVGTTALRSVESAALQSGAHSAVNKLTQSGMTDLFIFPPYHFLIADALITNFHVPRSSLMLLVDAFLEFKHAKRRIVDLYGIAIREQFRFFSFGDAMLIT